jgi:hypothetical protein
LDRQAEARHDLEEVEAALRRWDPIGVLPGPGDDQGPMDEYDSYAPQVLGLLMRGSGVTEVEQHLVAIRTKTMGCPAHPPTDRSIAEQLVSWWRERGRA